MISSLDGFIGDGEYDWSLPGEDVSVYLNGVVRDVGTYLYGRRMYETMAVWETMASDDQPAHMADFGNIWRAADKVVYSRLAPLTRAFRFRALARSHWDAPGRPTAYTLRHKEVPMSLL